MVASPFHVHPSVLVLCGVSTATFGGLTRDIICGSNATESGKY